MKDNGLLIFKALSDKSRLRIINNLINGPMYVELLSERLDLSPSTVSFHLKKLEDVGLVYSKKEQYYVMYYIKEELFENKLKTIIYLTDNVKEDDEEKREEKYKKKVLSSFFKYGKLTSIPVQAKKRRIVLEEMLKSFEENKIYTEREVNIIIADYNDDFCTLRKAMVSEGFLSRENGEYKKIGIQ
ncbi:MAG: metalloregulator ArsR/SmtB family transcription factor [Clostridium sp.]